MASTDTRDVFCMVAECMRVMQDATKSQREQVIDCLAMMVSPAEGETTTSSTIVQPPAPKEHGVKKHPGRGKLPKNWGLPGNWLEDVLLRALAEAPSGMCHAELRRAMDQDKLGVTRSVNHARSKGLIRGDRAGLGCRYSLTPKGREAFEDQDTR